MNDVELILADYYDDGKVVITNNRHFKSYKFNSAIDFMYASNELSLHELEYKVVAISGYYYIISNIDDHFMEFLHMCFSGFNKVECIESIRYKSLTLNYSLSYNREYKQLYIDENIWRNIKIEFFKNIDSDSAGHNIQLVTTWYANEYLNLDCKSTYSIVNY